MLVESNPRLADQTHCFHTSVHSLACQQRQCDGDLSQPLQSNDRLKTVFSEAFDYLLGLSDQGLLEIPVPIHRPTHSQWQQMTCYRHMQPSQSWIWIVVPLRGLVMRLSSMLDYQYCQVVHVSLTPCCKLSHFLKHQSLVSKVLTGHEDTMVWTARYLPNGHVEAAEAGNRICLVLELKFVIL